MLAEERWIIAALRGDRNDEGDRPDIRSDRLRAVVDRPTSLPDPDRQVVERLVAGESAALAELYDRYYAGLHRFVFSLLRSSEDASEIVTDLFVHLWERRAGLHIQTTTAAYLFGAARNRARNQIRAGQARHRVETTLAAEGQVGIGTIGPRADERVEQDDLVLTVRRVLDSLPDPGRTAATLRWMNELSYEEIGAILAMSPGAAQVHVSRVLKALRAILPGLL
jgi:RNA polymerase sigma-70 factor (ECF subfamily)